MPLQIWTGGLLPAEINKCAVGKQDADAVKKSASSLNLNLGPAWVAIAVSSEMQICISFPAGAQGVGNLGYLWAAPVANILLLCCTSTFLLGLFRFKAPVGTF